MRASRGVGINQVAEACPSFGRVDARRRPPPDGGSRQRHEHGAAQFANAAVDDVTVTGQPRLSDRMESSWMAETLKYFYLIFSEPELISLDDYILNTEAHPFKRPR